MTTNNSIKKKSVYSMLSKITEDSINESINTEKTTPVVVLEELVNSNELPTVVEKVVVQETANDVAVSPAPVKLEEAVVVNTQQFNMKSLFSSEETKKLHFQLYEKSVKDFNRTSAKLDGVDRKEFDSSLKHLKQEEVFSLNAVKLHELFFANTGDIASVIPLNSITYMRLARDWGTFDNWQYDFIASAMSTGVGWCVTGYDLYLNKYSNFMITSNDQNIPISVLPVIVLDMWEHSYIADYQNDKLSYVYGMMSELNWSVIESRMNACENAGSLYTSLITSKL